MPKKPKCDTCSTGWCKNHLLQLNPLSNSLYYRKNFKIRLCPRLNRQTNLFEKIIPLFNCDKKYYTPSFYLEEEKKYYCENDERALRNHQHKIQQDQNTDQTIWVPRHARKRNYCFVCKSDYIDYLQHMEQQSHKKCLRNNIFSSFIHQIEQKFSKINQVQKQQKKEDDLKRESPTEQSSSISECSLKSFEFIRKLQKPNDPIAFQANDQIIEQN